MKKRLLIATISIFGTINVINAQEISFGAKAGINFLNLYGSGREEQKENFAPTKVNGVPMDIKFGWQLGFFVEYMATEKFGAQIEVYYAKRGAKINYLNDERFYIKEGGYPGYDPNRPVTTITTGTNNFNSISIPVLAKFYPFNNFNIHVGPQVNFWVSSEEGMKSMDAGVAGGIGYELDMGLFLSGRYYNGFTNLVDYSEYYYKYLSSFQFSLGYKF